MPPRLEEYEGCICEVKSMENNVLATGMVNFVDEDGIELIGMGGEKLPLLHYNLPVKIAIFNDRVGFLALVGTVYISSDWLLKISELTTLQSYERRAFFRINVNKHAKLYLLRAEQEVEQADRSHPRTVKLVDVSLGGCLIETDHAFEIGDIFLAEFVLLAVNHEMRCVLQRTAGVSDDLFQRKRYGCLFEGNSERQQDAICRDLFQLQRIEIQKRRKNY